MNASHPSGCTPSHCKMTWVIEDPGDDIRGNRRPSLKRELTAWEPQPLQDGKPYSYYCLGHRHQSSTRREGGGRTPATHRKPSFVRFRCALQRRVRRQKRHSQRSYHPRQSETFVAFWKTDLLPNQRFVRRRLCLCLPVPQVRFVPLSLLVRDTAVRTTSDKWTKAVFPFGRSLRRKT